MVAGVALKPNCPVLAAVVGTNEFPKGAGVLAGGAPNTPPNAADAVVVVVAAPKPPPKTEVD